MSSIGRIVKGGFELMNEIKAVLPIREKYLEAYLDKERSHPIHFDHTMIRGVGYAFENEETCLLAICHNNFYHDDILRIHLTNIPDRFKENVVYKQLYSSHGHNDQTFESVDDVMTLYVKKGEVIALIGSSGSGKSTLMNLITRTLEIEKGNILLDNKKIDKCKRLINFIC